MSRSTLRYTLFIRLTILLMALCGVNINISAQNLNKEVYVVSAYRPEITDVEKFGFMPLIPDTFSIATSIDYSVLPSKLKSDYTLRPIKPAKMVGTPLDKLYNSQIKLGIGNYLTPLAEYTIQNLRSKEYTIGAYALHKSSHHKIDINQVEGIPAGYGRNEILGYGKRFYKDITLFAEAGATSHKLRDYGLNTEILADTFDVERSDIRQNYYNIYAKAGLHSARPDSGKLFYSLFVTGDYYWDHFKNKEPHVTVSGSLNQRFNKFALGLESDYHYFTFKNGVDTSKQSLITLHPFFRMGNDLQLNAGFRVCILNSTDFDQVYLYPEINLRIKVINNVLSGFVGLSGFLEQNTYQSLTSENPYLIPGLTTPNTNHRLLFYTGIEGHISKNTSYRLDVSAQATEDMVFFVNSDSSALQNQFEIVIDDADIIKLHGEIRWEPFTFLSFYVRTNYYNYKLYSLDRPWHRPAFELFLTTRYNFKEKIYADIDFIMLGKRYAQELNTGQEKSLDPIYDVNLNLEYKFSNVLSFFLNFYNLAGSEYYLWNQYPVQRLSVLGGIVYKF